MSGTVLFFIQTSHCGITNTDGKVPRTIILGVSLVFSLCGFKERQRGNYQCRKFKVYRIPLPKTNPFVTE